MGSKQDSYDACIPSPIACTVCQTIIGWRMQKAQDTSKLWKLPSTAVEGATVPAVLAAGAAADVAGSDVLMG
jgi:hypothetical protein